MLQRQRIGQGLAGQALQGVQHRLRLARLSESPFTDRLVNKFGLRVEGWRGLVELDPQERDLPRPSALTTPRS